MKLKNFNHWDVVLGIGIGLLLYAITDLIITVPIDRLWALVTLNMKSLILLLFAVFFMKKASQAYAAKGNWIPKERSLTAFEVLGANWMIIALTAMSGLCLYAIDPVLFNQLIEKVSQ